MKKQTALENAVKALVNSGELLASTAECFSGALVIPECRQQMIAVTKACEGSNSKVLIALQNSGASHKDLSSLVAAAADLSKALSQLAETTECAEAEIKVRFEPSSIFTYRHKDTTDLQKVQTELQASLAVIKSSVGDRNAITAAVRDMANFATQIVTTSKGLARTADQNTSARLLAAAKACADAVSGLVAAAKVINKVTQHNNL